MQEKVRITLDEMAAGGDAVGRYEGQVVFVPLALPGETVLVELVERRQGYARGALAAIEEPSPQRVSPPCPHFGRCGGCQWQHAAYSAQLAFKEQIVRSQLTRIGRQAEPVVRPMLGMADPWRYRNHVQLRVNEQRQVGHYALKSHAVVPTTDCPIAHPLLAPMWSALEDTGARAERLALRAGAHTGEQLAVLYGPKGAQSPRRAPLAYSCVYVAPSGARQLISGRDYYHERLGDRAFRVSADAFFQNNTPQAERMVRTVADYLQLQRGEILLDAYCGVGALGLSVACEGVRVLGIEGWAPSARDAEHNAQHEATIWQGDVAEVLASRRPRVDAIVLDPPRAGCTPETLAALAATGATRMAYVSCDPATLARDIARLNGLGYTLCEVQPIDMFPQTYHIEAVAWLERTDETDMGKV